MQSIVEDYGNARENAISGNVGCLMRLDFIKYDNGSLNAFEIVHKRYRGMQTAFSYNWFLLEILAQFYFISKYATDTLRKIIMNQHNIDIKPERVIIKKLINFNNNIDRNNMVLL